MLDLCLFSIDDTPQAFICMDITFPKTLQNLTKLYQENFQKNDNRTRAYGDYGRYVVVSVVRRSTGINEGV